MNSKGTFMRKYYGLFSLIFSFYIFFFYKLEETLTIIALFFAFYYWFEAPRGNFKIVSGLVLGALLLIVVGVIIIAVIAGLALRSLHYN